MLTPPTDLALIASMNVPEVEVTRKPSVALLATGDELVMPGETPPGPDQIIASNSFGLKAMVEAVGGAEGRMLPIARDNADSLRAAFELALDADLIVTIGGGASVGDRDLVGPVAAEMGMEQSFYKVRMRPGKPLMAGTLSGGVPMLGLPGNPPVSSMVCAHVFLEPMIRAMLGQGEAPPAPPRRTARLTAPIAANGPREHYMRAVVDGTGIRALERQDSAF